MCHHYWFYIYVHMHELYTLCRINYHFVGTVIQSTMVTMVIHLVSVKINPCQPLKMDGSIRKMTRILWLGALCDPVPAIQTAPERTHPTWSNQYQARSAVLSAFFSVSTCTWHRVRHFRHLRMVFDGKIPTSQDVLAEIPIKHLHFGAGFYDFLWYIVLGRWNNISLTWKSRP